MKYQKIIDLTLRVIVAAILLQTLYFKFTAHPDSVFIFSQLGVEPWGRIGLGVIELITAVLILIPSTKTYGMITAFGIILGAIFSHFLVLGFNVAGDGGVLFTLAIVVFIATTIYMIMHKEDIISMQKEIMHRIRA